jgi:hypothetical protein
VCTKLVLRYHYYHWIKASADGLLAEADPGFVVRGGVSRRGVWDRLRSPAGPRQSPGRGPRRAKPPGSSGGFKELQTFI